MEINVINIQEREAKQKVCPFLRENCKGSMCLSWKKVGKLEEKNSKNKSRI